MVFKGVSLRTHFPLVEKQQHATASRKKFEIDVRSCYLLCYLIFQLLVFVVQKVVHSLHIPPPVAHRLLAFFTIIILWSSNVWPVCSQIGCAPRAKTLKPVLKFSAWRLKYAELFQGLWRMRIEFSSLWIFGAWA